MFSVLSSGDSGKCMITSCAVSTSTRLLSGTPLGIPVVPEVYSRVVSSYVLTPPRLPSEGGVTAGCSPVSSVPNGAVPPAAPSTTNVAPGRCVARSSAVAATSASEASYTYTTGSESSSTKAVSPAENRKLIGDPIAPRCWAARYSRAHSGLLNSWNTTTSPGPTPWAASPAATRSTSAPSSA